MSNKNPPNDARFDALKNESARQRWQLFHRAIAHAKQSNCAALEDGQAQGEKSARQNDAGKDGPDGRPEPRLSIAR